MLCSVYKWEQVTRLDRTGLPGDNLSRLKLETVGFEATALSLKPWLPSLPTRQSKVEGG